MKFLCNASIKALRMEGNIFSHKKADQAFEDINSGASSLQITEVRARTEPGSNDNSAT